MEIFAKGQLSYMILNCLLERDFYGLDFISEINKKSNGRIELKKPSVYSNLTRMEKQGYVSSYTKSSEFGPNRRYYSITEKGKNYYFQLKQDFEANNIDVFRDFVVSNSELETDKTVEQVANAIGESENEFFDFSSLNSPSESIVETQKQVSEKTDETVAAYENNVSEAAPMPKPHFDEQEKNDDGAFLNKNDVDNYNQRIYDISKDIRKYKKQRSFAEDQIAMTVETPLQESEERNRANIEAFKTSLLENKNKYEQNQFAQYSERQNRNSTLSSELGHVKGNTYFQEKPIEKVVEDDGKFITNRIDDQELVRPKKIAPPRLKILPQEKDDSLPPPKRDVKIDPSHKEIISQLYSHTKSDQEQRPDAIYDYQDLEDYYKEQDIEFSEYKKSEMQVKHNTNKLAFYHSLIIFFMLATVSAAVFITLYYTGNINPNLNFLYILLPALQLIVVAFKFYNYKCHTSWLPKPMSSIWEILSYTLLVIVAIVGLNFIFGLNTTNFALYATTLILPILLSVVALPVSYFIQKTIIVKYWK